jgi:post-segregation antitoxin (ccd killing protein)
MTKCPKCGHDTNKRKLTLSVNSELIDYAKEHRINISEMVENILTAAKNNQIVAYDNIKSIESKKEFNKKAEYIIPQLFAELKKYRTPDYGLRMSDEEIKDTILKDTAKYWNREIVIKIVNKLIKKHERKN